MRLAGIAQTVNALKHRVHGGVKADGVVGRGDIVVDRTGHSDGGDAADGKIGRTAEGAVAADGDDGVDIIAAAGVYRLAHALFGLEFGAAVGIDYGSAHM